MTQSQTDRERAETEAATWLVLLSEDPEDRALAARFDEWRSADPLHAELWARTVQAYELAGKAAPLAGKVVPMSRPKPRAAWLRRRFAAGAVMAIAACLLLVAAPPMLLRLQADHVTATAELRSLVLEDGSRVRLGPESALAVDFAAGERRVRLLKGEAFFDVVPDANRPFRVAARDAVATVLGTAFEVRLGADSVGVAVQHGQVRVDGGLPPRSETLSAGDWVTVEAARVSRGRRNVDEIGDWLGGELVARDRPMMEIVDALRRYHDGAIVVRDGAFARTRVTGIYDLRHPAATLASLAASHDATVRRVSPWLLIVSSN
jgi:transmembrane sensor